MIFQNFQVKLNELVNPNKAIADYRTEITGVSSQDLEAVTCSLADIQVFCGSLCVFSSHPFKCLMKVCVALS